MKKYIAQITVLSLLAIGMVVMPAAAYAQDANTNAWSSHIMTPKPKGHRVIPYRGKVAAMDTKAMTMTVGKRTFRVTSDTKVLKDGQTATLADGVVGEPVRGAYKKTDDGKLIALSVYFGAKHKGKSRAPGSDEN